MTRAHLRYPPAMRPSLRLLPPLLASLLACGGKGDDTTGTGTTSLATSTGSSASTGASTAGGSGGHTGTSHEPTTGGSGSGTSTSAGTSAITLVSSTSAGSETGEPITCGEGTCTFGQICVLPCCGGPAPACTDPDGQGQCPDGMPPVPMDRCPGGCTGPLCCLPVPCQADPPFCAAPGELQCTGTQCSIDSCFGELLGDQLECQCA